MSEHSHDIPWTTGSGPSAEIEPLDAETLERLRVAPVLARWELSEQDEVEEDDPEDAEEKDLYYLFVDLKGFENQVYATATIVSTPDGSKRFEADIVSVAHELRGNRMAEKLARGLGSIAAVHGFEELYVDFRHPASLKCFRNVFGYDRMHFLEENSAGTYEELSLTEEQALETIDDNGKGATFRYVNGHKIVKLSTVEPLKA